MDRIDPPNPGEPTPGTLADRLASAEAARDRQDLRQALQCAEAAWQLATGAEPSMRLRAGLLLSELRYRTGALNAFVDLGLELLPLLQAGARSEDRFETLRRLAISAADNGRFDVALDAAQHAHALALELGDVAHLALATNALGCFFERIGDPWRAERLMLEGLALAREGSDPRAVFISLNNLCATLIGAYYLQRDAQPDGDAPALLSRAEPHARQALAQARGDGDGLRLTVAMGNLGEVLVLQGHGAEARPLLQEALAIADRQGFAAQVLRIRSTVGELQLLQGRPLEAWSEWQSALAACRGQDPFATEIRLHHGLWRCARALGRSEQALDHLETYLQLERLRSLRQLHGQSALFVTRVEAEQVRRQAERERARAVLAEHDSRRDALTRLGNRRDVEQRAPQLLEQARRSGRPATVAMIDVDHFKRINDRHGHAVGDAVLATLGSMLRQNTRDDDLVARIGGEEFLLLLADADQARAIDIAERLCRQVARHDWGAVAPGLQTSLSIGLAAGPPLDLQDMTRRADRALYQAKQQGRNRVQAA
jgi:diguanylate cyclase (GGDEF)-like protein